VIRDANKKTPSNFREREREREMSLRGKVKKYRESERKKLKRPFHLI